MRMHSDENRYEGTSRSTEMSFHGFSVAMALMVLSGAALAQGSTANPQSHYPIETARLTNLIVETVYPLKVAKYQTQEPLAPRTRSMSQATPEDVIVEMVSSMKAKDFNWNSALWDAESLKSMQARDAERGKKPSDWAKGWEREAQRSFVMLNRIEYGKYVLIEYEARNPDGKTAYKITMALQKVNGKWFLTQALSADPVLMHWNAPTGRVQIAPDTVFNK